MTRPLLTNFLKKTAVPVLFAVAAASLVIYNHPGFLGEEARAFDPGDIQLIADISLPFSPMDVVLAPDGSVFYAIGGLRNQPGYEPPEVAIIDTTTHAVRATSTLPIDVPRVAAIHPSGDFLYIGSDSGDMNAAGVVVMDARTLAIVTHIPANIFNVAGPGLYIRGMAANPSGSSVYFTDDGFQVYVLSTATNQIVNRIPAGPQNGSGVRAVAFSPSGDRAYVGDLNQQTIIIIDTSSETVVDTIDLSGNGSGSPFGIAATQDGTKLVVAEGAMPPVSFANSITEVDLSTKAYLRVPASERPLDIVLTQNDQLAIFTSFNVWALGRSSGDITGPITDGALFGLAINKQGTILYTVNCCGGKSMRVFAIRQIDEIPPHTSISLSGTQGNNSWFTSDVTVTLTATDDGSGALVTKYSLDNGSTFIFYTSPFIITQEGMTTVQYYSADNAGNNEPLQTIDVKIDQTAPEISAAFDASLQDFRFTPLDNVDLVPMLACSLELCKVEDEAGNATFLNFRKERLENHKRRLTLFSIAYNGIQADFPVNGFIVRYVKRDGMREAFDQAVFIEQQEILAIHYQRAEDRSLIVQRFPGEIIIKQIVPGIRLLQESTMSGTITLSI